MEDYEILINYTLEDPVIKTGSNKEKEEERRRKKIEKLKELKKKQKNKKINEKIKKKEDIEKLKLYKENKKEENDEKNFLKMKKIKKIMSFSEQDYLLALASDKEAEEIKKKEEKKEENKKKIYVRGLKKNYELQKYIDYLVELRDNKIKKFGNIKYFSEFYNNKLKIYIDNNKKELHFKFGGNYPKELPEYVDPEDLRPKILAEMVSGHRFNQKRQVVKEIIPPLGKSVLPNFFKKRYEEDQERRRREDEEIREMSLREEEEEDEEEEEK